MFYILFLWTVFGYRHIRPLRKFARSSVSKMDFMMLSSMFYPI